MSGRELMRLGRRGKAKQGELRFFTEANDLPLLQPWRALQSQSVTACRTANLGKNGRVTILRLRRAYLSLYLDFYACFVRKKL